MKSLFLDPNTWNLAVDTNRNIAVAEDPYALAQNVSNAVRVFKPEVYFDINYGIDYNAEILGKRPPVALIKQRYEELALTVAGVVSALCVITSITNRVCSGYIKVTDINGLTLTAGF